MDRRMSAALDRHITGNWGEDSVGDVPPSCEDCPEERYEKCSGQDKCAEVILDGHPCCCLEHKIEMSCGECGECQADMWASLDLDLKNPEDRVRLLKAGFTKDYPKRIEKLYLEQVGIKVKNVKVYELLLVRCLI